MGQMSGAQMVCEAIIAEGVKTIFGYPVYTFRI